MPRRCFFFFSFLRKKKDFFNEYFSFSLTWDPMGAKISKRYSHKSQPKVLKLVLNIPPNGPHIMTLGIFEILSLRFLMIFFQRSNPRSLRFRSLISCEGAELGHILLLNINRKAHVSSQMTLSHLTLSDLKRSNPRSLRFRSLISCEGAELGHKLLMNINRKAYMGSPMTSSHMTLSDLGRSNSRSLRFRSKPYIL